MEMIKWNRNVLSKEWSEERQFDVSKKSDLNFCGSLIL